MSPAPGTVLCSGVLSRYVQSGRRRKLLLGGLAPPDCEPGRGRGPHSRCQAAGGPWSREHLSSGANPLGSLCARENPPPNISSTRSSKVTSSRRPFVTHSRIQQESAEHPRHARHLLRQSSPRVEGSEGFLPVRRCPHPRPTHCLSSPADELALPARCHLHTWLITLPESIGF